MGKQKTVSQKIKHPGSMTRLAKKAGQSNAAFAESHQDTSGVVGEKARFYLNVLAKGGKKRK